METVYEIRKLLKRFGVFIYTGNRVGDLELMEEELRGLYEAKMLDLTTYQKAILILKREKTNLQ